MKSQGKIEFLLSVFIFGILILSIGKYISENTTSVFSDIYSQTSKIKGEKIVDILVNEKGIPPDWEKSPNNLKRLGLAFSPYNLSLDKVNALKNDCSLFEKSFNITGYRLLLIGESGNIFFECGGVGNLKIYLERTVKINSEMGKLILEIWW